MRVQGPEAIVLLDQEKGIEVRAESSEVYLVDNLRKSAGVILRQSGPGYFASLLNRGQDAKHLAILWEGVNIQSSINGTYDPGLISQGLFNGSRFFSSGHGAIVGNASLGGVLALDDVLSNSISIQASSIANQDHGIGLSHIGWSGFVRNRKFIQSLKIAWLNTDNAFDYKDFQENTVQRKHSRQQQFDIAYRGAYMWNDNRSTTLSYWWQDAEREFPGSITSLSANEHQTDINQRLQIKHIEQLSEHITWQTHWTYMDEYLRYYTNSINSKANNYVHVANTELQFGDIWSQRAGVQFRKDQTNANFYKERHARSLWSAYYQVERSLGKHSWTLNARQELVDEKWQRPTAALSWQYLFSEDMQLRTRLSNHINLATFNDLYWPTGGNPDLETEYSEQLDLLFRFKAFRVQSYAIFTKDKITWLPHTNGIWTPTNINATRSIGFDLSYKLEWKRNKHQVSLTPQYYYINAIDRDEPKLKLPFIPVHKANIGISYSYGGWTLANDFLYTSSRFTNKGNTLKVDGFLLWDTELKYKWKVTDSNIINAFVKVQNMGNTQYQLTQFFPQPLRHFTMGIHYQY